MDGLDFHVRSVPQTSVQAQSSHSIANAGPNRTGLAVLISKQRSGLTLGTSGIDQAVFRVIVTLIDHFQNIANTVIAQIAANTSSTEEPLAVQLITHQGFIGLILIPPKIVVFTIPQPLFQRHTTLFQQRLPSSGTRLIAHLVCDQHGCLQCSQPQNRDIGRCAGEIPGIVSIALGVVVRQAVAIPVQFLNGIHSTADIAPQTMQVCFVAGVQIVT